MAQFVDRIVVHRWHRLRQCTGGVLGRQRVPVLPGQFEGRRRDRDDVHVRRWVLRHKVRGNGQHVHGVSDGLVEDRLDDLRRQRGGDHQRVRRELRLG